ncbi:MAG: HTH-type transcriptional activator IlvY [Desulfobulbaceae bacterium]|nr:HTH-type transcriptional activator IlvY [Desulfobulbaceae bacterium]
MEIRVLQLFNHLAGSLHFGRTSRAMNVTPSALTRTIQRLEEEVGEPLFVRDNRSVTTTPAGERFREYAEEVLRGWQELQNDLARDEALRGDISIYCSVTAAYSILPRILGRFRAVHPEVHINLQTGDAARALDKLENGETDLTIAALPENSPPRLACLKIIETPLVFIAPRAAGEPDHGATPPIDWQQTPVIMADQGLSRERAERWFAEKKVVPTIYARVAGNEAIIAMVSLGCGVGIVPQLVLDKSPLREQIAILDVTPQLTPFSIGICTAQKNMANPRVQAFWGIAEQETEMGGGDLND